MSKLLLIAFLLVATPAFAAWSAITSTCQGADTSGAPYTTATPINTTGADLIVAFITAQDGTATPFSDSQKNTWTGLTVVTGTTPESRIYYTYGASVGAASHTFTLGDPGGGLYFPQICVYAFSGAKTSADPIDQSATGSPALSQTVQPAAITTGFNNVLAVSGASGFLTDVYDITSVDSSFIGLTKSSTVNVSGIAYRIVSTPTTIQPTWTFDTTPGTYGNSAVIASFQAAPAGGAVVRHKPIVMQ